MINMYGPRYKATFQGGGNESKVVAEQVSKLMRQEGSARTARVAEILAVRTGTHTRNILMRISAHTSLRQ